MHVQLLVTCCITVFTNTLTGVSFCNFCFTNKCKFWRLPSILSSLFAKITVFASKQWSRYFAQQCRLPISMFSAAAVFSSTVMSVYGLPTATIRLLALVMAVLKTMGLHRLLVGLYEHPDESTDSTVLMKRVLNSLPAHLYTHYTCIIGQKLHTCIA